MNLGAWRIWKVTALPALQTLFEEDGYSYQRLKARRNVTALLLSRAPQLMRTKGRCRKRIVHMPTDLNKRRR